MDNIPIELQVIIFEFLQNETLITLLLTCKTLYTYLNWVEHPNVWHLTPLRSKVIELNSYKLAYQDLVSIQKGLPIESLLIRPPRRQGNSITPFKVRFNKDKLNILHLKFDSYKQKCCVVNTSYVIHIHTDNRKIKNSFSIMSELHPMNVEFEIASQLNKYFNSIKCVQTEFKQSQTQMRCGILTPIAICHAKIDQFLDLEEENPEYYGYNKFVNGVRDNDYGKIVRVSFYPMYESSEKFVKTLESVKEWKIFIFQVLFILAKIHQKFPTFKHNELKFNSLAVFSHVQTSTCFELTHTTKFNIPQLTFSIQMTDFYVSSILPQISNPYFAKTFFEDRHINPYENKFADLYYFLSRVRTNCNEEIESFIDSVFPTDWSNELRHNRDGHPRFPLDYEPTTPEKLLTEHSFFDEFRQLH